MFQNSQEEIVIPNEEPKIKSKISPTFKANLKLGDLLRRRRNELNLSLDQIERSTHIRKKYLKLIEAGDYANLANDIYTKGYIKNYADHLGFESKEILKLYSSERTEYNQTSGLPSEHQKSGLKPIDSQVFAITPRTILFSITSIFVLIMVIYVGWQLSQLSTPPVIRLANQDKTTTNSSFTIVSGEVDSGSDVYINDSPILSSPDGSFSERVMLVGGSNQIKVSAKNKFGKESSKTIIVEAKIAGLKDAASGIVRNSTFDGVEISIKAGPQAVLITAVADGREVFKGTMLPNSKQLFQAKDSIKLSTGNAGSTDLTISNALVANKNIGTLGGEGESKKDIIFNKDTNVK